MVQGEMVRFYAAGAHGDAWDQPSAEQLLAVAAEMGEADGEGGAADGRGEPAREPRR
jgi:hypothetical protein